MAKTSDESSILIANRKFLPKWRLWRQVTQSGNTGLGLPRICCIAKFNGVVLFPLWRRLRNYNWLSVKQLVHAAAFSSGCGAFGPWQVGPCGTCFDLKISCSPDGAISKDGVGNSSPLCKIILINKNIFS